MHETLKSEALSSCGELEHRTIERASVTGVWLQVMPTHDNGMSLSPVEWRDGCFLHYARTQQDLNPICDGCEAPFSVENGQICKKGGLIIQQDDDIKDMIAANIVAENIQHDS